MLIAWVACYLCIRKGTTSVGKVVKYTVSLPVICLLILAIRGLTMDGAIEGLMRFFVPDWSALADSSLWIDAIGLIFVTGAGLAWLDIIDHFINSYTLVLTGIFEVVVVGWFFKTVKIQEEINKNTKKFRIPRWWFGISIKLLAPLVLTALLVWNMVTLFSGGGVYGAAAGYSMTANIIAGWLVMGLSLISGPVIKLIVRAKAKKGFVEEMVAWDEAEEDSAV